MDRQSLLYFPPAAALVLWAASGCAGPAAQLTQIQQEKDQLLTVIREQREQVRQAQAHTSTLEARLDEAEKQLASGGRSLRTASASAGFSSPSSPAAATPEPQRTAEPLPWRPHRVGSSSEAESLAQQLARRDRRVRWDEEFQAGVWNREIAFEPGGAVLSGEGRRMLDELADWLKDRSTAPLRVLVAGSAENTPRVGAPKSAKGRSLALQRAQAVADYLDRHGVAEERLAVSASGSLPKGNTPLDSDGVDILLVDPTTAVLGWRPPGSVLR